MKLRPAHIGHRARCPVCLVTGTIDDITDDGRAIIKHSRVEHCVVPKAKAQQMHVWEVASA